MTAPQRVLVINGHPDPAPERLTSALADAYEQGARHAGCDVHRINVGALDIPLLRHPADFLTPAEGAILEAQHAFEKADHIVFVYPLWLGGPPALLKGFMEQVARNQFLLRQTKRGFPSGALKGRSASVIVTMGMPAAVYRLWYGAHGVKAFNRSILNLAGIRPVATTLFGGVGIKPGHDAPIVEKARKMGRRLA